MSTEPEDPEIAEVRAARRLISQSCGNDPWKLMAFLESFRLEGEGEVRGSEEDKALPTLELVLPAGAA